MIKYYIILASLFWTNECLYSQVSIETIENYWKQKDYNKVIDLINLYYKTNKKRVLKLDVIKLSTMCTTGANQQNIEMCADYIVNAYRLPEQVANSLRYSVYDCKNLPSKNVNERTRTDIEGPEFYQKIVMQPYTRGKTGRRRRSGKRLIKDDSSRVEKIFSMEQLTQRRLSLNTALSIDSFYNGLLKTASLVNFNFKQINNFVIFYSKLNIVNIGVEAIKNRLDNYYRFYTDSLEMQGTKNFIPIFLMADKAEMDSVSLKLHGFISASNGLGYASIDDNIIVSIAYYPNKPLLGTVCHELVHILSNEAFGSLPAWLEEGISTLYEVSEVNGRSIVGKPNWRGEDFCNIIREDYFPSDILERLFSYSWNVFNASDEFINGEFKPHQSFNYAMSRFFMLYLQEKKVLLPFFKEASNYIYTNYDISIAKSYLGIAAKHLGVTDEALKNEFLTWVLKKCV